MDQNACCRAVVIPTRQRSNRDGRRAWRWGNSASSHIQQQRLNQIRIKPLLRDRLEPILETVVPSGPMPVSHSSSVDLFDDASRAPNATPRVYLASATDDLGDFIAAPLPAVLLSHGPTSQICCEISRIDGATLSETDRTQSCAKANPSAYQPSAYPQSYCGPLDSRSPLGQIRLPDASVSGRCCTALVLQAECIQDPNSPMGMCTCR